MNSLSKARRLLVSAVLCTIPHSVRCAEETRTIISSSKVSAGTHSVTIQRIEPPREITSTIARLQTNIVSAASDKVSALPFSSTPTRAEVLSLSCTRYECGVTEVRWQSAAGGEYRILSSIDFNYLRNTGAFTDGERSYTVFMGVGTAMAVTMNASGRMNLAAKQSPVAPPVDAGTLASVQQAGLSRYITLAAPAKTEANAFRGIDALHRYYDSHKAELIAQWQQLDTERIARDQYEKEHPPQPKDTVIQFWPKKNSRYLTSSATATDGATTTETTSGKEAK